MMIVPQVFGFVNRKCPEGREWRERFGGDLGCRGKGQQPLYPCFRASNKTFILPATRQSRRYIVLPRRIV